MTKKNTVKVKEIGKDLRGVRYVLKCLEVKEEKVFGEMENTARFYGFTDQFYSIYVNDETSMGSMKGTLEIKHPGIKGQFKVDENYQIEIKPLN